MAQAHSLYMTALYFQQGLEKFQSESTCKVLHQHLRCLLRIYCLHTLTTHGAALASAQYLKPSDFRAAKEALYGEYRAIRPQVLNLIEAFELDDNTMNSAIGNSDGNVYE